MPLFVQYCNNVSNCAFHLIYLKLRTLTVAVLIKYGLWSCTLKVTDVANEV